MRIKCKKSFVARFCASLLIPLSAANVSAAPVTPESALNDANTYLSSLSGKSTRGITDIHLAQVYTAKSDFGNAFYVFSDDNAGVFTIMSADTRLPKVLGYSLNNGFTADNMPCNLRWWLDSYAREISYSLASGLAEEKNTRAIEITDTRTAIEPMVTTHWNQSAPFNNLCPEQNGQRAVTGCVATAMAQAMKYHNWPPKGTGSRNGHNFNEDYAWSDMINDYVRGQYSNSQARAVAELMLACGQSVDMMYSPYSSGAQAFREQYALPTYFDYDKDCRFILRDFYSQKEWDDIIYSELQAGRPVVYGGQSAQGGHAFVCDGYSEAGYFHINWGWGGLSDGYFLLSALTPASSGIGGFDGGYNSGQTALIKLQKNDGEGTMQTMIIANGPFIYVDGVFRIGTPVDGYNQTGLIYNNLSEPVYVEAGVRIMDSNGNTVAEAVDPEGADLDSMYGFEGFIVDFPELADGSYRLYPICSLNHGDYQSIPVPYGCQSYVELTVSDGEYKYVNAGTPEEMRTKLVCSDIEISPYASTGCPVSFNFYVNNIGQSDYADNVSVVVRNSEGKVAQRVNAMARVASRQSIAVTACEIIDIPVGTYQVAVEDVSGNVISETTAFELGNTLSSNIKKGNVSIEIVSPVFVEGTTNSVQTHIVNTGAETTINVYVRVRSADGKDTYINLAAAPIRVPEKYNRIFTFTGFNVVPQPGNFIIDIADADGNALSLPSPLRALERPMDVDDVFYQECEIGKTLVARPKVGEYADEVKIENIDGFFDYVGVTGDAFTFAGNLDQVSFPATVERLGASIFWEANSLRQINLASETPFSVSSMMMPENRYPEVVLNVPLTAANTYKRTEIWSRFNIPGWDIVYPRDIALPEVLQKDTDGNVFNPYYVSVGERLSFPMQLPDKKAFKIVVENSDGTVQTLYSFDGVITLPAIKSGVGKAVIEVVDASGVESVAEDETGNVYDLSGRIVRLSADKESLRHLDKGIYIFCGKVIVIE